MARTKKQKLKNAEYMRRYTAKKRREDPLYDEKIRHASRSRLRLKRYGLTEEQFKVIATAQDWRCPITGDMITLGSHVDHCHETGIVRGILSPRANKLIGHAGDDVMALEAAIRYLKNQDRLKPAVNNDEQRRRISTQCTGPE